MVYTWASVVRTEIPRYLAISVLVRPAARSSLTCACLAVRGANHGLAAFPSRTNSAMRAVARTAMEAAVPLRKDRRFTPLAYDRYLSDSAR